MMKKLLLVIGLVGVAAHGAQADEVFGQASQVVAQISTLKQAAPKTAPLQTFKIPPPDYELRTVLSPDEVQKLMRLADTLLAKGEGKSDSDEIIITKGLFTHHYLGAKATLESDGRTLKTTQVRLLLESKLYELTAGTKGVYTPRFGVYYVGPDGKISTYDDPSNALDAKNLEDEIKAESDFWLKLADKSE